MALLWSWSVYRRPLSRWLVVQASRLVLLLLLSPFLYLLCLQYVTASLICSKMKIVRRGVIIARACPHYFLLRHMFTMCCVPFATFFAPTSLNYFTGGNSYNVITQHRQT